MANRSYLCLSQAMNLNEAFVSSRIAPIEISDDLLGDCPYHVPLLWLAMFREENLQEAQLGEESESVYAPIASISVVSDQLKNSLPYLDGLFSSDGGLSAYADRLLSEVKSSGFPYVYLNLTELEQLDEPARFRNHLLQCLRGFSQPEAVVFKKHNDWLTRIFRPKAQGTPHREALLSMTGLDGFRPIPRIPGNFRLALADKKTRRSISSIIGMGKILTDKDPP